jgi:lysozyme family protein
MRKRSVIGIFLAIIILLIVWGGVVSCNVSKSAMNVYTNPGGIFTGFKHLPGQLSPTVVIPVLGTSETGSTHSSWVTASPGTSVQVSGQPQTTKGCPPTLHYSSKGSWVVTLQKRLNTLGWSMTTDGSFGSGTDNAVKSFQTKHGLIVDGIVGPITWSALGYC